MFFETLRRRRDDPRTRLQYPLIWLLLVALQWGLLTVLRQNQQDSFWEAGPGVALLMTAWGIVSTRMLEQLPRWQRNPLAHRAAEFVTIATLMRGVTWLYVVPPPSFSLAGLRALLRDPAPLFDNSVFAYTIFALWCWQCGSAVASVFNEIDLTDYELRYFAQDSRERRYTLRDSPQRIQRSALLQDFFRLWIYGGILLIVLAAMSTVAINNFLPDGGFRSLARLPLPPAMLAALLVYLFSGLWLLAYGRSIVLYARWIADGVQSTADFARRWRRYGLVLLLTVGLLASLLPIGSTLPLATIVGLLAQVAFLFFGLILGLILRLFTLVAGDIAPEDQQTIEELLPRALPTPAAQEAAENGSRLPPELLGGLTLALVVVAVGAALLYLARHSALGDFGGGAQSLWARLREWWRQLWGEVQLRASALRQGLQTALRRDGDADAAVSRRPPVAVDQLTPREQVRYYYLQAVERAAQQGVARRPAETPAEFLRDLQTEWPDSAGDAEQLTAAFQQARYSPAPVDDGDSHTARDTWKRVRGALRRRDRQSTTQQGANDGQSDDNS